MDPEHYQNIFNYLNSNNSLEKLVSLDKKNQQQIVKQSKFYFIKNGYLYKKNQRKERENNLLRVVRKFELDPILYMMHNDATSGHFSTDTMFEKIRQRYYWPQMYENIREYVKSCDQCQRRGKYKRNEPLHPIPVGEPFHQIGIDFIGPLPRTTNNNRYIIVAMDYFTKWPEVQAVLEADR